MGAVAPRILILVKVPRSKGRLKCAKLIGITYRPCAIFDGDSNQLRVWAYVPSDVGIRRLRSNLVPAAAAPLAGGAAGADEVRSVDRGLHRRVEESGGGRGQNGPPGEGLSCNMRGSQRDGSDTAIAPGLQAQVRRIAVRLLQATLDPLRRGSSGLLQTASRRVTTRHRPRRTRQASRRSRP